MTTTWTTIAKASITAWTAVPKPSSGSKTTGGGTPIGLLLALTTSGTAVSGWTTIAKASGTPLTVIPKAT